MTAFDLQLIKIDLSYAWFMDPSAHAQIRIARLTGANESNWPWDSRETGFDGYAIWVAVSGRCGLNIDRRSYVVRRGDCFLLDSRHHIRATSDPRSPACIEYLRFDYAGLAAPPRAALPAEHRHVADPGALLHCLRRCGEAHWAGATARARQWLAVLLDEMGQHEGPQPWSHRASDWSARVGQVCDDISADPSRPWSVNALAARCVCSPDHFIRMFQRFRGCTPGQFVLAQRMAMACHLLQASQDPIAAIAGRLGYSECAAFSRQFKRSIGCTPAVYRERV